MPADLSFKGIALRVALLLVLVLPPLVAGLGAGDCKFHMEVRAIASSLETRQRLATDPDAWLVPSWNGAPRVNKPPLVVWMNLLAWTGLPADADVDTLVLRARWVGVSLALLALLATVWAGAALGHVRLGFAAAVLCGTMLFFLRQMRIATYDTHLLAFCTLAVAAGLWAMSGNRPASRAWCWLLAGLSLGAAAMSKGPLAFLLGGGPLALLAALRPDRRRWIPAALGSLVVAALVALPWYVYVLNHVPDAIRLLKTEFSAERQDAQPIWYYLGLIGLVFPWSLWLIAWLVRAIRRHSSLPQNLHLVAAWFVFILVVMSLPDAKQQRYILPILPAAALLAAGALWSCGDNATASRRLLLGHGALMLVASFAFGIFGTGQGIFLNKGWVREPELSGLAVGVYPLLTLGLVGLCLVYVRAARAGRIEQAIWIAAAWMSCLATPGLFAYALSPNGRYAHRAEVEQVGELTRDEPFYYLEGPFTEPQYVHPDPRFRLYARRVLPGLAHGEIASITGPAWITAPVHEQVDPALKGAGWEAVMDYRDKGPVRRLYRLDPP